MGNDASSEITERFEKSWSSCCGIPVRFRRPNVLSSSASLNTHRERRFPPLDSFKHRIAQQLSPCPSHTINKTSVEELPCCVPLPAQESYAVKPRLVQFSCARRRQAGVSEGAHTEAFLEASSGNQTKGFLRSSLVLTSTWYNFHSYFGA